MSSLLRKRLQMVFNSKMRRQRLCCFCHYYQWWWRVWSYNFSSSRKKNGTPTTAKYCKNVPYSKGAKSSVLPTLSIFDTPCSNQQHKDFSEIWFSVLAIGFPFIWKVQQHSAITNNNVYFQFLQANDFLLGFKTIKVDNPENHASLSHYSRGSSFTKQQHKNYTHTNRLLLVHAKVFSWRHTLLYPSFATYLYSKTKTGVTLLRSPHVCIFTTLN